MHGSFTHTPVRLGICAAGKIMHIASRNDLARRQVRCLNPIEIPMTTNSPDLTKQAPRSPRVRLGGYVTLPRMLDKGRATVAGKNGEYHYDCPTDQRFLTFTGIEAETLKQELATGKGDGEILEWIQANARHKRTDAEIMMWSTWSEQRAPGDVEGREYFHGIHVKVAPKREDIATWFDLLDLDDYASFGGKV